KDAPPPEPRAVPVEPGPAPPANAPAKGRHHGKAPGHHATAPDAGGTHGDTKPVESPEALREADLSTLFGEKGQPPATLRVTRLRAGLADAALRQDLLLTGGAAQTELSNVLRVT